MLHFKRFSFDSPWCLQLYLLGTYIEQTFPDILAIYLTSWQQSRRWHNVLKRNGAQQCVTLQFDLETVGFGSDVPSNGMVTEVFLHFANHWRFLYTLSTLWAPFSGNPFKTLPVSQGWWGKHPPSWPMRRGSWTPAEGRENRSPFRKPPRECRGRPP